MEFDPRAKRTVLHVGCGPKRLAQMPAPFQDGSWKEIRFDIDPTCAPDIIGTITDMSGVEDASVDCVFSSHNIEHVFPHEVPAVLGEFARVLNQDGFALITCPDLQALGAALAKGKLHDPLYISPKGPIAPIDILYGHRASVADGMHYMAHRGGFTTKSLSDALRSAGFAQVGSGRRVQGAPNIWAIGSKNPLPDEDLRAMMEAYFANDARTRAKPRSQRLGPQE